MQQKAQEWQGLKGNLPSLLWLVFEFHNKSPCPYSTLLGPAKFLPFPRAVSEFRDSPEGPRPWVRVCLFYLGVTWCSCWLYMPRHSLQTILHGVLLSPLGFTWKQVWSIVFSSPSHPFWGSSPSTWLYPKRVLKGISFFEASAPCLSLTALHFLPPIPIHQPRLSLSIM